ncbi:hypothetical protein [Deinococcus altitudinis]|uniref:hypothetical protein n=1 Tax=Deinococcus altitudinis TaxID=468914 RepID=UPI00389160CD
MSRNRGTYTSMYNWALDLAPALPGAAGWVLEVLNRQANYRAASRTVGQLVDALPYKQRSIEVALRHLVTEGYAISCGNEYVLRGACTELAQGLRTNLRSEYEVKSVLDGETTRIYFFITSPKKKEGKEEGRKEGAGLEIPEISDASLPALSPVQTSESEQIRADAQTADAVPEAAPSPEMFKTVEAIPETKTPPVGYNTTRAAPRAELPPVPVPPAVAFFTEVTGAFFARVQVQHLARWHGQYSPEFITLAWKLSALEERPTFAFADWLDRSPNKPWPDALRRRYELDVAPELAGQEAAVKPRELPVKPGDLVRWADGQTAKVERCERVDFVTDHEDDARGYVPYSAIGKGVEVLHS